MREIKFRAWSKEKKVMIEDIHVPKAQKDMGHIVMQFTGLKDKNGKEIYEGDIIEDDWHLKKEYRFMEVKFPLDFIHINECKSHMEVIGNIYENPELLKGDK